MRGPQLFGFVYEILKSELFPGFLDSPNQFLDFWISGVSAVYFWISSGFILDFWISPWLF